MSAATYKSILLETLVHTSLTSFIGLGRVYVIYLYLSMCGWIHNCFTFAIMWQAAFLYQHKTLSKSLDVKYFFHLASFFYFYFYFKCNRLYTKLRNHAKVLWFAHLRCFFDVFNLIYDLINHRLSTHICVANSQSY